MAWRGPVPPIVVVGGLTVLALVLRLVLLRDSLLGDELIMFGIVHDRPLGDTLHVIRETEKTPPLHFLLAWASTRVGDPTMTIRLPSLLAGVALVPVTYFLGRETVGRTAGLVAAAIAALQPFAIFYATEARGYALVALFAAASTVCLLRALDTRSRAWWAAYALAVLAAGYTHYVAAFVLVAQAAWAFWAHRERLRELLVVHGIVALGFLPWLPSFLLQRSHSGDEARRIAELAPPTVSYFLRANAQVLFGEPFASLRAVPKLVPTVAFLAVAAAGLAFAAYRATRGARPGRRGVLIAVLALASPVAIVLLSLPPDHSFLLPRNLSASAPALAVVVAWPAISLPRRAAVAGAAVLLVALAAGSAAALDESHRRSPYRDVAHWIDDRARPGDPVIQHFFFDDTGAFGHVMDIHFATPHPLFHGGGDGEAEAWARGRETGRVFVVLPLPSYFKTQRHLDRLAGPQKEFELAAEQRYAGLEDILVGEYRARAR